MLLKAAQDYQRFVASIAPTMYLPPKPVTVIMVEDRFDHAAGIVAFLMAWEGVELHLVAPDRKKMPEGLLAADIVLLDEDLDAKCEGHPCLTGYGVHSYLRRMHFRGIVASVSLHPAVPHVDPLYHFRHKKMVAHGDCVEACNFVDWMNKLLYQASKNKALAERAALAQAK